MMQRKELSKQVNRREFCHNAFVASACTVAALSLEQTPLLAEMNKPDRAGSVSVKGD
jgi:hypothetical protein